jgi:hypothetical protein
MGKNFVDSMYRFREYQQQTLDATREVANIYVIVGKEFINLFLRTWSWWWTSTNDNLSNKILQYYYWFSPKNVTNIYTNSSKLFTDYINSAAVLASNNALASIEISKILTQQAISNAKELSEMTVNTAKVFEATSR